jgi:hypothetical protein
MSYYFKCKGLTKPQIIKLAKMLAEREGLKLVDSFEKDLNELNRRYPCEVVISKCKRVLLCREDLNYRKGFKELKVRTKLTVEQANKELDRLGICLYFDEFNNLRNDGMHYLTPLGQKKVVNIIKRLTS